MEIMLNEVISNYYIDKSNLINAFVRYGFANENNDCYKDIQYASDESIGIVGSTFRLHLSNIIYWLENYCTYYFQGYYTNDINDAFAFSFTRWLSNNMDNLTKLFMALHTTYNPLNNYEKHGHIDTVYGSDKTTNKLNKGGNVTDTTTTGKSESDYTTKVPTFDSETGVDGGSGHSENKARTDTMTYAERTNESVRDSHTDTVIDTTYGNIGTTMGSQLITGELSIRQFSYIDVIMSMYKIDRLTVYVGIE